MVFFFFQELSETRQEEVVGNIDYVHRYINVPEMTTEYKDPETGNITEVSGYEVYPTIPTECEFYSLGSN